MYAVHQRTVLNELATFPTTLEWARESLRHFASTQDPDVHGSSRCAGRFMRCERLLEESDKSLEEIAWSCGFGSVDTMNRAFRRETGRLASAFRGEGGRVAREA
jgi:transcriptional regulator GlxA family with amidase domain